MKRNMLHLYLSNHRWKNNICQVDNKVFKIYKINQRLKLWERVTVAVSSFAAAAHTYR